VASEPPVERVSSGDFPQLSELVRTGALRDDDFSDYGFRFGLERILDGIGQLIGPTATSTVTNVRTRST
jgi:hypothetical protein